MNYNEHDQQISRIKSLIALGKEQGFLTYSDVSDHLPDDIVDSEKIDEIIQMIDEMGIDVYEMSDDVEPILLSSSSLKEINDDEIIAEATALVNATTDFSGRTTDPVRMYMREMGTVDLLTREGEVGIAKRIEEGNSEVLTTFAKYPKILIDVLQEEIDKINSGEIKAYDVINGFIDDYEEKKNDD